LIFCEKHSQDYDNVHCSYFCFHLTQHWYFVNDNHKVVIAFILKKICSGLVKWCNNRYICGFFSKITKMQKGFHDLKGSRNPIRNLILHLAFYLCHVVSIWWRHCGLKSWNRTSHECPWDLGKKHCKLCFFLWMLFINLKWLYI
jgi:hypothetical protein